MKTKVPLMYTFTIPIEKHMLIDSGCGCCFCRPRKTGHITSSVLSHYAHLSLIYETAEDFLFVQSLLCSLIKEWREKK